MAVPVGRRAPGKQVLAFMHSFASDDRNSSSHRKVAGRHHPPKSLYDHANSFFLSLANRPDGRDVLPPEEVEEHRDRQVLAELIELVSPEEGHRLAGTLLAEFGTIGRILGESEASLSRVLSGGNTVIRLLQATERLMLARLEKDLPRKLVSATDERLVQYLRVRMGSRTTEIMRVLFLDGANRLIGEEEFGAGSPQRILLQPRSILKRALELDASGIILAHNHPGGNPMPSNKDIKFTRSIKILCVELEIRLQDHIIISGNGWTSFRKMKIL
tara:strand:- start:1808 stop:2626 length:819 start_codon:yes stop_codon:yes gene_type:complete